MIRSLLLGALLCTTLPAQAGTVIAEPFARVYCQAMDAGLGEEEAIAAGVSVALITGNHWHYVRANGKTYQSDVVAAVRLSMRLCPQHFPSLSPTTPST